MQTSDISYFEHSHQGMWLTMDFLECWEKFCLKNPFLPNLEDCGRKNVINVAFSPPLLCHKKPTRGPAPILLPLGLPPCCQCREDARHPGCPARAWGHRAGLVPDLSPGLDRRGTGRVLSPWFWRIGRTLFTRLTNQGPRVTCPSQMCLCFLLPSQWLF